MNFRPLLKLILSLFLILAASCIVAQVANKWKVKHSFRAFTGVEVALNDPRIFSKNSSVLEGVGGSFWIELSKSDFQSALRKVASNRDISIFRNMILGVIPVCQNVSKGKHAITIIGDSMN